MFVKISINNKNYIVGSVYIPLRSHGIVYEPFIESVQSVQQRQHFISLWWFPPTKHFF